jgi:hypothetical protein
MIGGSNGKTARTEVTAGDCTLHAESCGCGIGVFLLVQRCCPLLIHGPHACYLPAIYEDANGETSEEMHQRKPMYLSQVKWDKLESMYLKHEIVKELVRTRGNSDRVIRSNWY